MLLTVLANEQDVIRVGGRQDGEIIAKRDRSAYLAFYFSRKLVIIALL